MQKDVVFNEKIVSLAQKAEQECELEFKKIDKLCELNSFKVLQAFRENNVSEMHFNSTTGYGYNDIGREVIEKVFAQVLVAEDALVRSQFISGTHALTVALFAFLRPGDIMLSITGKPYDTLDEVIGIKDNKSSLKSFGVKYEQVDLIDNDFDYDKIKDVLSSKKIKLIEIQRSKGYSTRSSLTIDKLEKVINVIKRMDIGGIVMIADWYGEFVGDKSPGEGGAEGSVGSLIKNLGGGIAPNGAYIAGRTDLVDLASERLTVPGEGREVGPTLGINKQLLQGLFMAPSVVASSLKTAVFASYMLEQLGYNVEPKYNDTRADIVQNIIFNDPDKLIAYCRGIQAYSPIDSYVMPDASDMPGYVDKVIMASGSFTQGSSIELSCDGPLRSPYIAYQQGGLTFEYGKLGVMNAINNLIEIENK